MATKPQPQVLRNAAIYTPNGETLVRIEILYPQGATIPWAELRKLPQEEGSPGYPPVAHHKKK